MVLRTGALAWLLTASVAGAALGAVGVGLWTGEGRDVLTRYGVSVLNQVVHGTAEVGEVSGTLYSGFTARDVVIRGEDGLQLAHLPEVELRYRVLDLLVGRYALGRVTLREPRIDIVRLPNGRLNFEEVLGLGGSGGGGRKPLVEFQNVRILGGTVTIRTPTDDAGGDHETEVGPDGRLMRVRRVDSLDAGVSYARLSSPFEGENPLHFDIDDLSARFSDPGMDIRSLTGHLDIDGDSIVLDLSRLVFPETETALQGTLSWPNGPLLLALDLDAGRLAVNDARPFVDGLPWGLEGSGQLAIRSLGPDRIRVRIDSLRLGGGGGLVDGRFGIVVDRGVGWTLEDTELAFDSLALDYLRPMVDTIPFFGRVSGELVAAGPRDSLSTGLRVWFRDSLVDGFPQTHIRGSGILDLESGIRFRDFWIDSSDVALSTVRRLLPSVGLLGQLAMRGSLDGPWRDVTFTGILQHRDGGLPESIARGVARLDSRTDTVGVWADLVLDSLDFAGIHRSYPSVPSRGIFGGGLRLDGYADSLAFSTNVSGRPGWAVLSGALTLLPGTRAVHDLRATFQALDVQALAPSAPPTELYGTVTGSLAARDGAGARGELALVLDTSFVAGSPVDSLFGVVRLADSTTFLDSVEVWGPSLYAVADGGLARSAASPDTLRLGLAVDSLGVLEPLVRDRFASLNDDSLLVGVSGVARADLTITGSAGNYDVGAEVAVPVATSRRATLEGLDLQVQWPWALDGPMAFVGTLDSAALGRFHYADLDLHLGGRRNAASWIARARLGEDGSWTARGATRVEAGVTTIPIDFMGLLLPAHRWFLNPGAVVTIREAGYDFANVSFASESGGGGVAIEGRIPRGGSPGSLTGDLVGVPLTDVWGLAQLDPDDVGGLVSGSIGLSGSATDPIWEMSVQWNDGRFGSVPIPMTLEASADYADQRLTGDGAGWRLGERVLSLDFDLPVDLALEGVERRQLPGPLSINATGEDIDLSLVGLLTPSITDAAGRLDADVGITGSWQEPRLRGTASITGGGASFLTLGVTYRDVEAALALSGDTIHIERLAITSGEGRAEFGGFVRLQELTRPVLDVRVAASDFHLIDVPQVLALTTSGGFMLRGPLYGVALTGEGTVTQGDLYFADLVEKQIVNLEDTLYAALVDVDFIREQGLAPTVENRLLDSLRIDSLSLEMGSNVRLLSTEADIQLTGRIVVSKIADRYRLDGTLATPRGTYQLPLGRGVGFAEFVVREFDVTGGQVQYFGTPDLNADVDIDGRYVVRTTKGETFNVFVHVGGTLYAPIITLSSDVQPELPEDEIISYLLFNAPSVEALGGDIALYAGSLALGAFSSQVVTPLVSGLGLPLDYFRVRPPGTAGLSGTEVSLGWQISEKTFVTLSPRICRQQERGLTSNFGASLEYRFSPNWHFAASNDPVNACTFTGAASHLNRSQLGLDLFWEKRY